MCQWCESHWTWSCQATFLSSIVANVLNCFSNSWIFESKTVLFFSCSLSWHASQKNDCATKRYKIYKRVPMHRLWQIVETDFISNSSMLRLLGRGFSPGTGSFYRFPSWGQYMSCMGQACGGSPKCPFLCRVCQGFSAQKHPKTHPSAELWSYRNTKKGIRHPSSQASMYRKHPSRPAIQWFRSLHPIQPRQERPGQWIKSIQITWNVGDVARMKIGRARQRQKEREREIDRLD